jgi:hypothetical protein
MTPVFPSVDQIALPAPVWLLQFLSALTFVLHIIPMNFVLGGGLIAAVAGWVGRSKALPEYEQLAETLAKVLPVATAASITLGIPPLLFLQALYGPMFYTSSVLMAWPWLSVIAILMIGYYAYYYMALRKTDTPFPLWAGVVSSISFILIAYLYTNNMLLMIQPEHFWSMWKQKAMGMMLHPGDPVLWPRFLHFLVGAIAVSGLLVMTIGLAKRRTDQLLYQTGLKIGGLIFTVATVVQFGIGTWQLIALKGELLRAFMGGDVYATALFMVGLSTALVALMLILVAALGRAPVLMTIAGSSAILVTIVLMSLMRAFVRDAYLGGRFLVAQQPVIPQWSAVIVFLVLMVGGIAVVGWMVHAVVTRRGMDGAVR